MFVNGLFGMLMLNMYIAWQLSGEWLNVLPLRFLCFLNRSISYDGYKYSGLSNFNSSGVVLAGRTRSTPSEAIELNSVSWHSRVILVSENLQRNVT